jgi:hypothetical protein
MKRILYVFVLSLVGLGFGSNNVRSAILTWNGSTSTDWNNATNWLPQQVPATNDHVIFNSGTLTAPTNGVFAIMDWTGGTISGSLTVKSNAVLNISGSLSKMLYGSLTNAGTVVVTSTSYLQLYYSPPAYYGAIYNLPGALFDIQNDQFYLYYAFSAEFFNNAGTLRKSAGSGTTQIFPQLINTGLVDAQTGTISFNSGGTIAGQFNAAASATINFANGSYTGGAAPQLTGAGAFQFNGATLTLSNNVIPNLQMLGGTLALGPAFQGGSITNLTLPGTSLAGTNTVTGVATLGGGGSGVLTVASNGVVNWAGGGISGLVTVKSNAVLNLTGPLSKILYGSLTNAGKVVATGTSYLQIFSPGAFYNLPGALFDIQNDQFYLYYAYGTEIFNNAGTLRKSAGTGTTQILVQFNNTGLVDAQTGTIAFGGGGAIASQFNTAASTTINFANGNFTAGTPPQLTGAGTFQFNGATLTLSNNVIPNLQMLGGMLVPGPAFQGGSITNLTLPGTSLAGTNTVTGVATLGGGGSGVLTVASNGVVNWTGGGISGSLMVKSNAVLNLTGPSSKILYGSLTNAGTVVVTSTSYLQIYNPGAFYNLPGALFDIQNDQFYLYYAYGTEFFNNAGTLRKSAGTGTTAIYPMMTNTGLIEADSGTIGFQTVPNLNGGEVRFGLSSLSNFGKINISGNATLTGTVGIALLGGYVPAPITHSASLPTAHIPAYLPTWISPRRLRGRRIILPQLSP